MRENPPEALCDAKPLTFSPLFPSGRHAAPREREGRCTFQLTHYEETSIIIATLNHNIELRKPLSHRKLAKKLNISPSSLSDIIRRAQEMPPARYGNKKIQYYPLNKKKLDARKAAAACRHAAANRTPETFFEELRKEMSKKGKDGRSLKGKIPPETALKNIKKRADEDPEYARKVGKIPCLRTIYNRINSGVACAGMDASWLLRKGRNHRRHTGEHKGRKAHTCPEGHSILDMDKKLLNREETRGGWEMDTVHSCRGGTGGLLTLTERTTRMSYAVYIAAISEECVCAALSYLMATNKLGKVTAILTDNGSEFRNWRAIEAIVHAKLYYTLAYSAWQKGSVERYNLQLRELFFPKGTDFSKVSKKSIDAAVDHINSLVRSKSLKGLTAYEAFSTVA